MLNIFCIDLEDWYHQNLREHDIIHEPRVEKNTNRLLEILDNVKAKATFFCLGSIVEEYPSLIRKIHAAGHEIASHGYNHQLVYSQNPDEFREDVHKSIVLIEDACGVRVKGYRAPSWSITKESLWAIPILEELGLYYDSSVFPINTFLYGIPDAPRFTGRFSINGVSSKLLEVPPSTFTFWGRTMGFSGGFYFRAIPRYFIRKFTSSLNVEGHEVVFYLHPREIDPDYPRIKMGIREKIILDWNISGCEKKLEFILKAFKFTSISDFYNKEFFFDS